MARMLRFGGPNLPEGTLTYFYMPAECAPACTLQGTEHSHGVRQVFARPGEFADPRHVFDHVGENPDGSPIMKPNAEYYVESGRASYVEMDASGKVTEIAPENVD